jgi:hypothetical protein
VNADKQCNNKADNDMDIRVNYTRYYSPKGKYNNGNIDAFLHDCSIPHSKITAIFHPNIYLVLNCINQSKIV